MKENARYQRRRAGLVAELQQKGITDERVLHAIAAVPRHRFVEDAFVNRAYNDEALPIGLNQTISQPYTVAFQTQLLDVQPGDRILEIGTGSGFQAAVLCELGARVFSIERHRALYTRTKALLHTLGYRVQTRCGDGTLGWASYAPFDGIIVTAGAADVPPALLDQLRRPDGNHRGGSLVIPVGNKKGQYMNCLTCTGPDTFARETFQSFRFVPLVGEGGME